MILVPLRDRGNPQPLYFIPAAASSVILIFSIASEFEGTQSCFGIQPSGIDNRSKAECSVYDMARSYIAMVRARQPEGPYYLGGHSFRGLVALEMARQPHGCFATARESASVP